MKLRNAVWAVAASVTAVVPAVAPSAQAAPTPPPKPTASPGQHDLANLATRLDKRLGNRSVGSYLDEATGQLIVTVTDGSAAQSVRAAGATPRMVTRSRADLTKATDKLDESARIPGTAWAVDPATDQVVVSADESVKGAKLTKLTSVTDRLGSAVRVERLNGKLSTLAGPTMLNGSAIYTNGPQGAGRCSLGFNVFSGAFHYFITAGHCTHAGNVWHANQGLTSRLGANSGGPGVFGAGGDFGIVNYDTAGIHVFGTVAGSGKFITSSGDAVVGLSIRRSGSTTGVRGGKVTGLNTTVTYDDGTPDGITVNGLIKTNACAEPGDSGGPLYDGGSIGLGVLSGGAGGCSGGTTVYQPLNPILTNYALTLWDTPQP
ncbi:S1 family peptidase [Actinomadura sp. 6N118]|uniref:S1 family peptidase n=1 Tax=Actinomadura sp. 6N118 TaxID=3375151 RepID=UPI0037965E20